MADNKDHLYPAYHFRPAAGWMNDPNGLIHWQGHYHLFYQYNPNGAFHGTIHWGHATSDDLARWRHLPIAVAPGVYGPDQDGVFSGCAVDHDGVPTLVYTGIRPETQCLAIPVDPRDPDLVAWRKHPANPVIASPPPGAQVEGFRDPYVWREADGWYCAIGSGLKDVGGCIFLYRSDDLVHWDYLHELCRGVVAETGRMWECPNFFPLGDKHVLLLSPIPQGHVLYMVGEYRDHRFAAETMGILDAGGSYYAPQAMCDERGRRLIWGWLREDRDAEAQREAGWSGVMSLPCELALTPEGALAKKPAPEVEGLRVGHRRWRDVVVTTTPHVMEGVDGWRVELNAVLEPGTAEIMGISILRSPDGAEETRIVYDRSHGVMAVDRRRASLNPATRSDLREVAVHPAADGSLGLRIFVDGSVVEIFASDGTSISSRVYPSRPDSTSIGLFTESGTAVVRSLDIWRMSPIWPD